MQKFYSVCVIKSSPKVMSKSFWEKFQLILLLLNNGHMKNDFYYWDILLENAANISLACVLTTKEIGDSYTQANINNVIII